MSGRSVLQTGLASSLAALTAACSETSGPPARTISGDRASVSRSIFSEDDYGVSSSPRVASSGRPVRKGGGTFKLGAPYKVAGRWYVPREEPGYDRSGVASWYGDDFHGRATANGEIFDMTALTAAHPTLPMPCYAYVTNLDNNRTIMVRINDRGPYVNDRLVDLSHASARALGYEGRGMTRVRVRYAGRAPLNGDDRRERQFLASQPWVRGSGPMVASVAPLNAPLDVPREFPAGTAGRWSPTAYRMALAGKPVADERPDRPSPPLPRPVMAEGPRPPQNSLNWVATPQAPYRRDDRPYDQTYDRVPNRNDDRRAAPLPSTYGPPRRLETSSTAAWAPPAGTDGAGSARRAYVQVGTFRDRANAERMRRELGGLGAVEVAPVNGPNGEFYKVRIGPMATAEARATINEVSARGVAGSTIVTE